MAVESGEFATEPVPDHKTVSWVRVALVAAMVAFSLPTFLTGLELAVVSSAPDTALMLLVGAIILTLLGSLTGGIGASTRLSSYMLNRVAFGRRGAALVNLAFALSNVDRAASNDGHHLPLRIAIVSLITVPSG